MNKRWNTLAEIRSGREVPRLPAKKRTSRATHLIGRSASRWLAACALAIVLLTLAGGCGNRSDANNNASPETLDVTISGRTFHLDLALDDATRFQGLSDRESIPEQGGMLFVFTDARERRFVMRRCPNPIDILFLSENGRIVKTHEMKPDPPGTREGKLVNYPSEWPALAAIELRGGTIVTLGIVEGQKIDLPLEALKKRAR